MNARVHVMRESVVKLTQMLAGQGVRVTQQGVSAYVKADHNGKPIVVNLPYMPDNASDKLIDAIQGFLDHEVAHILFTDFKVMGKAMKAGADQMFNLIEDTRIERAMANRFQGSAQNLENTSRFFLDNYTIPRMKEAAAKGNAEEVAAILMVPLMRAMSGQSIYKEFMSDKMDAVQGIYDKIKDLAGKVQSAKSSDDALDIAVEVTSRLRDGKAPPAPAPAAAPPAPMPMPGAGAGGGKGDEKGKAAKVKVKAKAEPKEEEPAPAPADEEAPAPAPAPDEEGEEEEPAPAPEPKAEEEEPAPAPEEEEEPAPAPTPDEEDEGEDEPAAPAAPDEEDTGDIAEADAAGEEEDGTIKEATEAGGGSDGEVDTTQSAGVSWDAIDKETARDFDETMSSIISDKTAEAAADAEYIIFTTDKDVVEKMHVGSGYRDQMLTSLQDSVDHMVSPLQKDLERAIAARSLSQYSAGHRSGKLHSANLARLAVGDDRVFRRKHEATSKDVAVELVVDASGSMDGQKIMTATYAAYALASVLERIGIKSEVICFTTGECVTDYDTLTKEQAKLGRSYSRIESLYMPILKGFEERMGTDVKKRFGWLPHSSILANNVDGECIEIAGRRLLARRESGKIMMVLSDGAPHAGGAVRTLGPHLKRVVANLTKTGVSVIGIGIQSDAVRQFYPKSLVLNDVSQLPAVVMKELRGLIIQ